MKTLYIMCGVGFSGKSTLAKRIAEYLDITLVSQDKIFFDNEKEMDLSLDDDLDWEKANEMCKKRIKELLQEGNSVVFDNTNLRFEHRESLRQLATSAGAKAFVIFLDTPEALLKMRQEENLITKERHDVKQEYLDDAKKELEVPKLEEDALVYTPLTNADTFLKSLT